TLFGTARLGGSSDYGSVFKISTDGSGFTVLKQFAGSDGAYPLSGMVWSGTTFYGGTANGGSSECGVVFGINTDDTGYRVVKEFAGSDGYWPSGPFALSGSVLSGPTSHGGSGSGPGFSGGGTVFKVNTDGAGFSVLKNFATNDAGVDPCGGLVLGGF